MFRLYGLPEGIVGKTLVRASSREELFQLFPALREIQDKLHFAGNEVRGYAPCDG